MSALFESYLAGQVACAMEFAPMFWPTINSYAPRRRLLGAGQADLGRRQPHRELSRDRGERQVDASGDALPGADANPYLARLR